MRKHKKLIYISLTLVVVLSVVVYYFLVNYSFHFLTEILLSNPDEIDEPVSDIDGNSQDIVGNLNEGYVESDKNSSVNETADEPQESVPGNENGNTYKNSSEEDSGLINSYGSIDSSLQEKIEKNVSIEDKREALRLVMSKLTSKDISFLISLAGGGLTGKEKNEAVALAYERFTPEEINKVKALYNKYIFLIDN